MESRRQETSMGRNFDTPHGTPHDPQPLLFVAGPAMTLTAAPAAAAAPSFGLAFFIDPPPPHIPVAAAMAVLLSQITRPSQPGFA